MSHRRRPEGLFSLVFPTPEPHLRLPGHQTHCPSIRGTFLRLLAHSFVAVARERFDHTEHVRHPNDPHLVHHLDEPSKTHLRSALPELECLMANPCWIPDMQACRPIACVGMHKYPGSGVPTVVFGPGGGGVSQNISAEVQREGAGDCYEASVTSTVGGPKGNIACGCGQDRTRAAVSLVGKSHSGIHLSFVSHRSGSSCNPG